MNVITRNIPNTITCINLIAGCVAIVLATHSTTPLGPLTGLQWSYIAIAVAAISIFQFAPPRGGRPTSRAWPMWSINFNSRPREGGDRWRTP